MGCGPSRCFTCDEPRSMDACMCGCAYLNGGWPIFLGQFFSLMAGLLSVGTIIDCSFATIDEPTIDLGEDLQIEAGGVGFLFVQKSDGWVCVWCWTHDKGRFGGFGILDFLSYTTFLHFFAAAAAFLRQLFVLNCFCRHCYWYNYAADEHPEDKLQAYWSILGTPWEVAAILTWACASLSSFFFL